MRTLMKKMRRVHLQVLILACVSDLRPTVGFAPVFSPLRVCRGRQHGLPLGLEITCRGAEQERPHTLADSGVSTAMRDHAHPPLPAAVGPAISLLPMVLRAMHDAAMLRLVCRGPDASSTACDLQQRWSTWAAVPKNSAQIPSAGEKWLAFLCSPRAMGTAPSSVVLYFC